MLPKPQKRFMIPLVQFLIISLCFKEKKLYHSSNIEIPNSRTSCSGNCRLDFLWHPFVVWFPHWLSVLFFRRNVESGYLLEITFYWVDSEI